MAITIGQNHGFFMDGITGATTNTGASSNWGAGQDVVVLLTAYNGTPLEISAVSVSGTACTKAIGAFESGGSSFGQLWYARNITGGNKNISITPGDATGTWMQGSCTEVGVGGLASSGIVVTTASIYDNNGTNPRSLTTSTGSPVVGDLVITVTTGGATSVQSGQTETFRGSTLGSGFGIGQGMYKIATGAGNQTMTYNDTSAGNAEFVIAVLKASTASGYTLTADQGSYNLTGQTALLKYQTIMAAAQGSYALTGQTATLSYNAVRTVLADQGFYNLTGSNALVDFSMNAEFGSYTLNGQNATLIYTTLTNRTLVADQGSYALTGYNVNFLVNHILVAGQGQYNLNGRVSTLTWSGAPTSSGGQIIYLGLSRMRIGL